MIFALWGDAEVVHIKPLALFLGSKFAVWHRLPVLGSQQGSAGSGQPHGHTGEPPTSSRTRYLHCATEEATLVQSWLCVNAFSTSYWLISIWPQVTQGASPCKVLGWHNYKEYHEAMGIAPRTEFCKNSAILIKLPHTCTGVYREHENNSCITS